MCRHLGAGWILAKLDHYVCRNELDEVTPEKSKSTKTGKI